MTTEKSGQKKHRGLMAIAVLKFVNGFGLLALGFGALHFLNGDLPKEFAHWIELLRADPHNRYLLWLVQKLSNVDEHRLRQLSVGTFFYAALFLSEGTGLALAKRWAEYLTIVTTASLMPLEVYEIYVHLSWARVVVLVVNIAVVAYLVVELRRTKGRKEG
jgi:uncharacterized membrane protein (DUF2068 family)